MKKKCIKQIINKTKKKKKNNIKQKVKRDNISRRPNNSFNLYNLFKLSVSIYKKNIQTSTLHHGLHEQMNFFFLLYFMRGRSCSIISRRKQGEGNYQKSAYQSNKISFQRASLLHKGIGDILTLLMLTTVSALS